MICFKLNLLSKKASQNSHIEHCNQFISYEELILLQETCKKGDCRGTVVFITKLSLPFIQQQVMITNVFHETEIVFRTTRRKYPSEPRINRQILNINKEEQTRTRDAYPFD